MEILLDFCKKIKVEGIKVYILKDFTKKNQWHNI